jgi:hypothetical protein
LMEKFFSPMPKGYIRVSEAQKTIFLDTYGMSLFGFLFVGELGTCPKKTTHPREV